MTFNPGISEEERLQQACSDYLAEIGRLRAENEALRAFKGGMKHSGFAHISVEGHAETVIEDFSHLNCPLCNGSGHIDDARRTEEEIAKLCAENARLKARWDEGPGKEICEAKEAQARLLKENGELKARVGELKRGIRLVLENAKRVETYADFLVIRTSYVGELRIIYDKKEASNAK